ncbi:helix-turn-helix domain-containing protein [Thauera sinica]|uniref:helix-turn-helix domain-containing protein n=1 Tax=Thauera sp. K11 TaxID=2005884 RepID=UPI0018DFFAF0
MAAPTSDGLDGLGARLSLAILHLAISQSEFARQVGASPGFISDVVRGVKRPGAEFLFGIKQTFGISTDWLLSGDGTMLGGLVSIWTCCAPSAFRLRWPVPRWWMTTRQPRLCCY